MATILKYILPALFLISLSSCSLPQAPKKVPSRSVRHVSDEDLLSQAETSMKFGDARGAMNLASKSIKNNPHNPRAYAVLARSLALQNRLEDSARYYQRALDLDLKDRNIYAELGSIYDVLGKYEKALRIYNK